MPKSLPSDGRNKYEWQTRYTVGENGAENPSKVMRGEAIYLGAMMFLSACSIIANYKGFYVWILNVQEADVNVVTRIVYCLSAGLLGGVTFSIKIFYRAVAHGQWNYDRRYWRWFQPFISLSVTSVVAAFMIDDIVSSHVYWTYSIGYFAGYFSENAVGKMYDIAVILFSSPVKSENEEDANGAKEDKSN